MDRDLRWEKERQAFDAMVTGHPEGGRYPDPIARIKELYNNGITDEFIPPFTCLNSEGEPIGLIRDHDVIINFNYRADRVRQITRVLTRRSGLTADPVGSQGLQLPKAAELDVEIPLHAVPTDLHYVCMTQYDKNFKLPIVIPPESMDNLLANLMAEANLRNLRVAETEKYAHVTYFFNGGIEKPFPGEDRALIPSQKVATYDLAPEMSASGIADAVIKAVNDTAFDVIIVNFANADMVGHSGKMEPTIRAVETVDTQLGRIYQAIKQRGGSLLVTADHGNAEMLIDPAHRWPPHRPHHQPRPIHLHHRRSEYPAPCARAAACATSPPQSSSLLKLDQPNRDDRRQPPSCSPIGNFLSDNTRISLPTSHRVLRITQSVRPVCKRMNQRPPHPVPQRQHLRRHLQIAEPVNLGGIGPTFDASRSSEVYRSRRRRPTVQRSRMSVKLEVLHIMVMPGKIQCNLVLPQQGSQILRISVVMFAHAAHSKRPV